MTPPPPLLDIAYASPGGRDLYLDLHRPSAPGPVPVVVWLHPGGWRTGNRREEAPLLLLERGFAVAPVAYRSSREAIFPAQIQDAKAAIRWLRAHGPEHGLDPGRIGVFGASSGGHLAALVGLTGSRDDFDPADGPPISSAVQAVCDWCGPVAFLEMNAQAGSEGRIDHDASDSPESELLGAPIQTVPDRAAAASPLSYVHPGAPPFLIVHGTHDPLVPPSQSQLLHDALEAAGVESRLDLIPGTGHAIDDTHLETMAEFFEAHLGD